MKDTGSGEKKALVVGVNEYEVLPSLKEAVPDAIKVCKALQTAKFEVEPILENPNNQDIIDAIKQFAKNLNEGDVALLYFAGHGSEHGGINYLFGTDGRVEKNDKGETETYGLKLKTQILKHLTCAGGKCYFLILIDACRDDPKNQTSASRCPKEEGTMGFPQQIEMEEYDLVYACQPGKKAKELGFFAQALCACIMQDSSWAEVVTDIKARVGDLSGEDQRPQNLSNLRATLYLQPTQKFYKSERAKNPIRESSEESNSLEPNIKILNLWSQNYIDSTYLRCMLLISLILTYQIFTKSNYFVVFAIFIFIISFFIQTPKIYMKKYLARLFWVIFLFLTVVSCWPYLQHKLEKNLQKNINTNLTEIIQNSSSQIQQKQLQESVFINKDLNLDQKVFFCDDSNNFKIENPDEKFEQKVQNKTNHQIQTSHLNKETSQIQQKSADQNSVKLQNSNQSIQELNALNKSNENQFQLNNTVKNHSTQEIYENLTQTSKQNQEEQSKIIGPLEILVRGIYAITVQPIVWVFFQIREFGQHIIRTKSTESFIGKFMHILNNYPIYMFKVIFVHLHSDLNFISMRSFLRQDYNIGFTWTRVGCSSLTSLFFTIIPLYLFKIYVQLSYKRFVTEGFFYFLQNIFATNQKTLLKFNKFDSAFSIFLVFLRFILFILNHYLTYYFPYIGVFFVVSITLPIIAGVIIFTSFYYCTFVDSTIFYVLLSFVLVTGINDFLVIQPVQIIVCLCLVTLIYFTLFCIVDVYVVVDRQKTGLPVLLGFLCFRFYLIILNYCLPYYFPQIEIFILNSVVIPFYLGLVIFVNIKFLFQVQIFSEDGLIFVLISTNFLLGIYGFVLGLYNYLCS